MTANYTPDFTKTCDVFVSRDGKKWAFIERLAIDPQPVWLESENGTRTSFSDSGRWLDNREDDWDIVSQYTPAAAERDVPQDIPQWCRDAAAAIVNSLWSVSRNEAAAIITRHAPKDDTAVRDFADNVATVIAREESTPPAKPDATKWPRFAMHKNDAAHKPGSLEGFVTFACQETKGAEWIDVRKPKASWSSNFGADFLAYGTWIETDAEGNELPQPIPGEVKVEVKRYSISASPHHAYMVEDSCGTYVAAADHDAVVAAKDAVIAELRKELIDSEDESRRRGEEIERQVKNAARLHEIISELRKEVVGLEYDSYGTDVRNLRQHAERTETELTKALEHERQTHERLGAILGTDDSLEECAKRLKADRDAIQVQWQSLHDEREEQYAALRRRGIKFVKVGGILEAIGADVERDMLKSGMPQADIDEAEEVAEGCVANSENLDDVSHPELSLICNRLLELRYQRDFLQRHVRERDLLVNELTEQLTRAKDDNVSAFHLVALVREALGDDGKRMQPEFIEYCKQLLTQLAAVEKERDEAKAEIVRIEKQFRFVVNTSHNGLKVCVGNHATSDKCEWDYYVREEKLTELQSAYAKLANECEGLRERFERAKKLLLGYRGWFERSGRIDVNQETEIAEIDQALSTTRGV